MAEYTYKDIIIDPTSEEAKNAVGKICYFSNSPRNILSDIYCKSAVEGILTNMDDGYFEVDNEGYWDCIILKKEEPKKYVPLETLDEFIESYKKAEERINYSKAEDYIASCGMWLKDTDRDVYCSVTEIWNYGVVVGDSNMNTTKDGDEYFTMNGVTEWKQLFREYTFMDDTPCGKEVEDE